jgi:hypothetical protein
LGGSGRDTSSICGGGLHYTQLTAPIKVAAGKTDVKVIPAGQTCSVPSLVEKTGIEVGSDQVVTIAYMGGSSVASIIAAMPETSATAAGSPKRLLRFVNAIPGSTLEFGLAGNASLPATMTMAFSKGVEFGSVSDRTSGVNGTVFDANGYLSLGTTSVSLVTVREGTTDALLLAPISGPGSATLYAIGEPKTTFPIRGLLCREVSTDSTLTDCLVTDLPIPN